MSEKKAWTPTPKAFQRLLTWLRADDEDAGVGYLDMRRRLVAYFDRRECSEPDDLADEVFNRVARRLEEEGITESETPAKYCYIVARFVLMEHRREAQKAQRLANEMRVRGSAGGHMADESSRDEAMLACLERCAGRLQPRDRDTIVQYYAGSGRGKIENRRALARFLGISVNALSIRACRLREALYQCVRRCLDQPLK